MEKVSYLFKICSFEGIIKAIDEPFFFDSSFHAPVENSISKAHFDFEVRVREEIAAPGTLLLKTFDGEVTGLKEEGFKLDDVYIKGLKDSFADLEVFKLGDEIFFLDEEFDEKGRRVMTP